MRTQILIQAALVAALSFVSFSPAANATSNYNYKSDEYVVINNGRSPNGRYSIAAHGEGELGYDNFHIYLMDGRIGKKIGPLEEITDTLDTGANAFYAKWSADGERVFITYRYDRHVPVRIGYRIKNGRAYRISGPTKVDSLEP